MKIIITGSKGYLGSYLKKMFEEKMVVSTPDFRNSSLHDFKDCDVLINCIGKTGDGEKNLSYENYLESNYNVTVKLYRYFLESDAQLFIHFSSISAVEELMSDVAVDEDAGCNPISSYGITKRLAEEFLISKMNETSKKVIILRPTRIYGPNDKGTIFQLYNFLKKGIPYPFYAFDNLRSFLAIDNLTFFIEELIKKKDIIKSGIYNVNDDEGLSTKQIIQTFEIYGNIKVKKFYIPKFVFSSFAKIGDVLRLPFNSNILGKVTKSRIVSNAKIKKELRIKQLPYSAEEGLIKTVKSFQKEIT